MISRRAYIASLLAICILSAAIGSGITLLAKTGPEGPAGASGPQGEAGPRGFPGTSEAGENAEADVINLEGQVEELEGRVQEAEGVESQLSYLEDEVQTLGSTTSEICSELNFYC